MTGSNLRPMVSILGVHVDSVTLPELLLRIQEFADNHQKALVLHVNVQALNLAYRQAWLRDFFNQADVVFCDGSGVLLGARLLGRRLPERITYADCIWDLARVASQQGYRIYFLGARPGVAQRAADRLRERHPDLQIVGVQHGYFDKHPDSPENRQIIADINQFKPDILLVGFGMPLQEAWLRDNWHRIQATVALTGGAVFDYASGNLRRAPRWITDHHMEWVGRLLIEPRRLWYRYILGNPLFLFRVIGQRLGCWRPISPGPGGEKTDQMKV